MLKVVNPARTIRMDRFEMALQQLLQEAKISSDDDPDYRAAVAIVQDRNKWLLGLAKSKDDRNNRWCMPGGGIKDRETPEKAAVRECWEETGIRSKAVGEAFELSGKKGVAFVHCKVTSSSQRFKRNHEFTALGFFTLPEMKALRLYKNVLTLIKRVR